jgi:hypothetical protein
VSMLSGGAQGLIESMRGSVCGCVCSDEIHDVGRRSVSTNSFFIITLPRKTTAPRILSSTKYF